MGKRVLDEGENATKSINVVRNRISMFSFAFWLFPRESR